MIHQTSWVVTKTQDRERPNRIRVIAVRGKGTARQVINISLTPEAADLFDPDFAWSKRSKKVSR